MHNSNVVKSHITPVLFADIVVVYLVAFSITNPGNVAGAIMGGVRCWIIAARVLAVEDVVRTRVNRAVSAGTGATLVPSSGFHRVEKTTKQRRRGRGGGGVGKEKCRYIGRGAKALPMGCCSCLSLKFSADISTRPQLSSTLDSLLFGGRSRNHPTTNRDRRTLHEVGCTLARTFINTTSQDVDRENSHRRHQSHRRRC